jgi:hypothetical protein
MKLFIGIALAVLSTAYAQTLNACEGVPDHTFIPNLSQCNGWFRCPGMVAGFCDSPWMFNAATQACDWPEAVTCFVCPSVPFENIPINGTCVQYVQCVNGFATQRTCQNGLHFNRNTGECDTPANANCTTATSCPPNIPPGETFNFRSETSCSIGFVCVSGVPEPEQRTCNPALHFDPVSGQCTFPNMTDCTLPPGDGVSPDPNPPGNGTTTPLPVTCPASEGTFPHPATCSSFIVCVSFVPTVLHCSPGLEFNEATRLCDFPGNANCSRR